MQMRKGWSVRPILLGVLATALLTTSTKAYELSAENMVSACRTWTAQIEKERERLNKEHELGNKKFLDLFAPQADSTYEGGLCFGVLLTVLELTEELEPKSCPPQDVTYKQVLRAILTYAERWPPMKNQGFITFMLSAMRSAWPCKGAR
jgi:hypothetical protein